MRVGRFCQSPSNGYRFGEAKNPGPQILDSCNVTFGICNPTVLHSKQDTCVNFVKHHNCDLLALAETAATKRTQHEVRSFMQRRGYRTLWSPPVEPRQTTISAREHVRGQASGVAVFSALPTRASRNPIPHEWSCSTRFAHTIIQLQGTAIQFVTLYCQNMSIPGATAFNDGLLKFILEQVQRLPLPYIICGDFNRWIPEFEVWPWLQQTGHQHLGSLYPQLYGSDYPTTCQDATSPDNAIVSPTIAGKISSIVVAAPTWFATHRPVVVTLHVDTEVMYKQHMVFPRQLPTIGLDCEALAKALSTKPYPEDTSCDLETWGKRLEDLASVAVQQGHTSLPAAKGLPRPFRGRCQPRKLVKSPITAGCRIARQGDFEPSHEVITMKAQRQVKQHRRVLSLMAKIRGKLRKSEDPARCPTLLEEWKAITHSRAFTCRFLHWVWKELPELSFPENPLPSLDWLHQVQQLTKFHVEATLRADYSFLLAKQEYQRHLDTKHAGCKQAFAMVRGPTKPLLTSVHTQVQAVAVVVPLTSQRYEVYLDAPSVQQLRCDFPVLLDHIPGKVVSKADYHFEYEAYHDHDPLPSEVTCKQSQHIIHPPSVAAQLNQYWQPIWQSAELDVSFLQDDPDNFDLQCIPPVPEHIQVDLSNIDLWIQAVAALKSGSARGPDCITAQEIKDLPLCLLRDLAATLQTYQHGFPAWYMVGFVIPQAKVMQEPRPDQSRPITVLSQTYRLWGKTIFTQISRFFADYVPRGVTGLLPRRGALDAAFQAQHDIEIARFQSSRRSGITLDLRKCFNNLCWRFIYAVLKRMGVPPAILSQWMHSLSRLQRYWIVADHMELAGGHSVGCPEGDHFSVLAMIGVAAYWVWKMSSSIPPQAQLSLSAYADNWSWACQDATQHREGLRITLEVTTVAGPPVDWNKTWFWATATSDSNILAQLLHQVEGRPSSQRQHHAKDLGVQLHYSGHVSTSLQQERVAQATERMARVQAMPYQYRTKEHLILAGVLPVLLHGVEVRPLSKDTLETMRSKVARALLGYAPNATPCLALAVTVSQILDPEYQMFVRILLHARRWLQQADDWDRLQFLQIVTWFNGGISEVTGPAAAVSYVLSELTWHIDLDGMIHAFAFTSFSLLYCSKKRLRKMLAQAWLQGLLLAKSHRYKHFHSGDVNREATVSVLKQLPEDQLPVAIKHIAFASQSGSQRLHWNPDDDGTCAHCHELDTRTHRLLECPVGDNIREPYLEDIRHYQESGSNMAEFTVVPVHPYAEGYQALQFKAPDAILASEALRHVEASRHTGVPVVWFTDGSCKFPNSVDTRFSAYAIILDLAPDDSYRENIVRQHGSFNPDLPCFACVAAARTQGEQDILRAEMQAIMCIILQARYGEICTDSQAAIDLVTLALSVPSMPHLSNCAHCDILFRIWDQRHLVQVTFRKIRSHQEHRTELSLLQQYYQWGNAYADSKASHALQFVDQSFGTALEELRGCQQEQREQLLMLLRLHLALHPVRAQAAQQLQAQQGQTQRTADTIVEAFSSWSVPQGFFLPRPAATPFLTHCAWGEHTADKLLTWLSRVRWPADDSEQGPLEQSTGTTWVGMFLSFAYDQRVLIPVLRQDDTGEQQVLQLGTMAQAREYKTTLSEQAANFRKAWENTEALTVPRLAPQLPRRKVPALYVQGYRHYVQGIVARPELPQQSAVARALHAGFLTQSAHLDWMPDIPLDERQLVTLAGSWKDRSKRATYTLRLVRQQRSREEPG
eukprot:Skav224434  [mRNA]  locus=scaffold3233:104463:109694:+ [translate_table: standard]